MKQLFFLIFILTAALNAFAQAQFVSPGTEWWYTHKGGMIYSEGWYHIYYEKDTVLANYNCKKLFTDHYSRNNSVDPFQKNTYPIFVRQQGDSIYLYEHPAWLFRWRTNPNEGDSYIVPENSWSNDYNCHIHVDSIKEVNINGKMVKKIFQQGRFMLDGFPNISGGGGSVVIYSHLGPEYGVFDYTNCWTVSDCLAPNLCQYKNDEIPLYQFNNPNCNLIIGSSSDIGMELSVQPNPCTDYIRFDFGYLSQLKDLQLSLIDQTGREIVSYPVDVNKGLNLQTSHLPPGIYYYFITHQTGQYAGKFVKG